MGRSCLKRRASEISPFRAWSSPSGKQSLFLTGFLDALAFVNWSAREGEFAQALTGMASGAKDIIRGKDARNVGTSFMDCSNVFKSSD